MANQQPLNTITIEGNVGRISDVRQVNNVEVFDFTVANNRSYTRDGGQTWEQDTTWARVTVWGASATAIRGKLSQGTHVLVEGRLMQPSAYQTQGGEVRASNEIRANTVRVLDNGNDDSGDDDPLPF